MKLRIRFEGRTEVLELADSAVLTQDLREVVAGLLGMENRSFMLSLNGRTPLPDDDNVALSDVGIVGGDLLHVILHESQLKRSSSHTTKQAVDPTLLPYLMQMAFPKGPASDALLATGNSSLDQAVDIHNVNQPSTSSDTAKHAEIPCSGSEENADCKNKDKRTNSRTEKQYQSNESDFSVKHKKDKCNLPESLSSTRNQEFRVGPSQVTGIVQCTPKALLCRDGISYALQMAYELAEVATLHEAVCVAIHILMMETGFVSSANKVEVNYHFHSI